MNVTDREIDIEEVATQPELWSTCSLAIGADAKVDGEAHIFNDSAGINVSAYVHSYKYQRHGETRLNHIPMVTVTDPSGKIIGEPHDYDSDRALTAIERAIRTAEWAFEHYQ